MNVQEFRQVIVLSGTDYNKEDTTNLQDSIRWFYAYKRNIILSEDAIQPTFYEWLAKNTNYIKNMDVLLATYNLFRQKNLGFDCPDEIKNENKERLIEMLGHDGFVFV
jgi:hypothetical protein